jgi:hypothetical protein
MNCQNMFPWYYGNLIEVSWCRTHFVGNLKSQPYWNFLLRILWNSLMSSRKLYCIYNYIHYTYVLHYSLWEWGDVADKDGNRYNRIWHTHIYMCVCVCVFCRLYGLFCVTAFIDLQYEILFSTFHLVVTLKHEDYSFYWLCHDQLQCYVKYN